MKLLQGVRAQQRPLRDNHLLRRQHDGHLLPPSCPSRRPKRGNVSFFFG